MRALGKAFERRGLVALADFRQKSLWNCGFAADKRYREPAFEHSPADLPQGTSTREESGRSSRGIHRAKEEAAAPTVERFLTLLVEGAAAGVPEVEPEAYRGFRSKVEELARRLPDRLPDEEKLALIQSILREFTSYRNGAETALREQQAAIRSTVAALLASCLQTWASIRLQPTPYRWCSWPSG